MQTSLQFATATKTIFTTRRQSNVWSPKMQSSKGSAAHAPTSGAFNSPRPFKNLTTDTLLLDSPDGQQSLNNMYSVLRTMAVLERLAVCMSGWPPVGNIPNGYNRTCPLLRLLVRQQARVPVGQQVRQSGTFPTGRAQTALTIIRYQPSYSLPLLS